MFHSNDLAKKLEALEQQTNKRFEQLQAILTPCQNQTMQMAVSSKQRERTQERHLAMSARIEKTTDTESELTDEPGRLLSELTSEKTTQHASSQVDRFLRMQQSYLQLKVLRKFVMCTQKCKYIRQNMNLR